jgi:hypothetical protein
MGMQECKSCMQLVMQQRFVGRVVKYVCSSASLLFGEAVNTCLQCSKFATFSFSFLSSASSENAATGSTFFTVGFLPPNENAFISPSLLRWAGVPLAS